MTNQYVVINLKRSEREVVSIKKGSVYQNF